MVKPDRYKQIDEQPAGCDGESQREPKRLLRDNRRAAAQKPMFMAITGPAGVVVVRGPEVAAYHNKLAQGLADLVRAIGKEITSVLYYPPQEPGRPSGQDEKAIEDGTELEPLSYLWTELSLLHENWRASFASRVRERVCLLEATFALMFEDSRLADLFGLSNDLTKFDYRVLLG